MVDLPEEFGMHPSMDGMFGPEWISVNDRWPTEGDWVILGGGDAGVEQGYNANGKEFYLTRTDGYGDDIRVFPTHWMPLPNPPKEGQ